MAGLALKMPQNNPTHMDVERRFGASLRWLNSEIHGFSLPDTAKPSGASVKALSELAIAYAWLVQCRNRVGPLANCAALETSSNSGADLLLVNVKSDTTRRPPGDIRRRPLIFSRLTWRFDLQDIARRITRRHCVSSTGGVIPPLPRRFHIGSSTIIISFGNRD